MAQEQPVAVKRALARFIAEKLPKLLSYLFRAQEAEAGGKRILDGAERGSGGTSAMLVSRRRHAAPARAEVHLVTSETEEGLHELVIEEGQHGDPE
jgi:hypothetical protein